MAAAGGAAAVAEHLVQDRAPVLGGRGGPGAGAGESALQGGAFPDGSAALGSYADQVREVGERVAVDEGEVGDAALALQGIALLRARRLPGGGADGRHVPGRQQGGDRGASASTGSAPSGGRAVNGVAMRSKPACV
ncbi:hypothetical protein K7B10_02030 [Streptomyces flavotricini]|uniref:Uncharacterized protein n=1 Tax=Streptomyces flavotricini TaxID=66888 RepID=A0ABS8DXK2_9ACTN|nr:hypothetical protein [Streptomyces flavotricini]